MSKDCRHVKEITTVKSDTGSTQETAISLFAIQTSEIIKEPDLFAKYSKVTLSQVRS